MKDAALYYSVGALLYCPANNDRIANSIINENFGRQYSLALCLEDTINDACVSEAEAQLVQSLIAIYNTAGTTDFFIPKIFIRVRTATQMANLITQLGSASGILSGFIIPKFSPDNADSFISTFQNIKEQTNHPLYMMPILENPAMIHLQQRYEFLYTIKDKIKPLDDSVLNIRVGGNDLCHMFGFRRHSDESIHSIRPISNIFSDIITVFGMDYVVSGPVWEYYNGPNWKEGLQAELKEDALCGFVGKTVIHPNQISVVNEAYQVDAKDFEDAKLILNWDLSNPSLVSGNTEKERMNEQKTHSNWARRTLYLAETFGIRG